MATNPREADSTSDKKGKSRVDQEISQWSSLKNPRIVRVSRALGGKDRHSKVCTVRGLRDRRVRLSVPTAIQLYDLQDRLGLNQPSKVVDWLLNVAKHEIDDLPPLQIPPRDIGLNHQLVLNNNNNNTLNWDDQLGLQPTASFWTSDGTMRDNDDDHKGAEIEEEEEEGNKQSGVDDSYASSFNLFLRPNINHSSVPNLSATNFVPYNSFYSLDPSNYSLSHLGSHGLESHKEDLHKYSNS